MQTARTTALKRRATNLTIREDILNEAKTLNINTSQAAEMGISQAISQVYAQQWKIEHQQAIAAHNQRVDKHGTLLTPDWINE